MTSIEKSTETKCVSFHVLHTCSKFHQPRGNNKKKILKKINGTEILGKGG